MTIHPHAIEISGGTLKFTTTHTALGTTHRFEAGNLHFFVNLIEEDGGRACLWDGGSYGQAIIEAEAARRQFQIEEPVRDVVVGGPA